jgi:hypothetical protein
MNKLTEAIQRLAAARPASGFKPETSQECEKLQQALEEFGYAMFRDQGQSEADARTLAHTIYGGVAGRLLMEMSFGVADDRR